MRGKPAKSPIPWEVEDKAQALQQCKAIFQTFTLMASVLQGSSFQMSKTPLDEVVGDGCLQEEWI